MTGQPDDPAPIQEPAPPEVRPPANGGLPEGAALNPEGLGAPNPTQPDGVIVPKLYRESGRAQTWGEGMRTSKYKPRRPVEPYDRQAGETTRAWRAFKAYRDMGIGERTIAKACRSVGITLSLGRDYSVIWRWRERVEAYDEDLERAATRGRMVAIEKMEERHIAASMMMQDKVIRKLRTHEPETLSNKDIPSWLDKAVKIERQARGLTDGAGLQVNVTQQANQQQAQASTTTSITAGEKTIAQMVEEDPALLSEFGQLAAGILDAVDHSTGNGSEPEAVSGE